MPADVSNSFMTPLLDDVIGAEKFLQFLALINPLGGPGPHRLRRLVLGSINSLFGWKWAMLNIGHIRIAQEHLDMPYVCAMRCYWSCAYLLIAGASIQLICNSDGHMLYFVYWIN